MEASLLEARWDASANLHIDCLMRYSHISCRSTQDARHVGSAVGDSDACRVLFRPTSDIIVTGDDDTLWRVVHQDVSGGTARTLCEPLLQDKWKRGVEQERWDDTPCSIVPVSSWSCESTSNEGSMLHCGWTTWTEYLEVNLIFTSHSVFHERNVVEKNVANFAHKRVPG